MLAEFDGDPRAAIWALLSDLASLAGDYDRTVSRGFVRGAAYSIARRHDGTK